MAFLYLKEKHRTLNIEFWLVQVRFFWNNLYLYIEGVSEILIWYHLTQSKISLFSFICFDYFVTPPGHWPNELSVCQWSGRPGFNPRSSHTKDSKKWYLMPPCLTLSIKVGVKGKVEESRERSSTFPYTSCSSYSKGSLRVTLN